MLLLLGTMACARTGAQTAPPPASDTPATITVRSTLVLVPALVKTKGGELVFSLSADDFVLTDDGVPQTLHLEPDTDSQPLALAVVIETGGVGKLHLNNYEHLEAMLDAIIGNVPHRVGLVTFDSQPHLAQNFTADTNQVAEAIVNLDPGDDGAAILDALTFATGLLSKQPPAYRRALLLISETIDNGSDTNFTDALRVIDDTNTSIYSFGFPSTKGAVKHEASKFNSSEPGPANGCMSHAPDADPDAHGNRAVQAYDCASELLPPLRLARMAFLLASDGLKRNVPESVARLTGGEYSSFKDTRSLSQELARITNDVPNHYVLSFRPQSPHSGFHALELKLKDRPDLNLKARTAYWVETGNTPKP